MPGQLSRLPHWSIQLSSTLLASFIVLFTPPIRPVSKFLVVRDPPPMPARAGQELRRCAHRFVDHGGCGTGETREFVDGAREDEEHVGEGWMCRTADGEHLQLRRGRVRHLFGEDCVLAPNSEFLRVDDE